MNDKFYLVGELPHGGILCHAAKDGKEYVMICKTVRRGGVLSLSVRTYAYIYESAKLIHLWKKRGGCLIGFITWENEKKKKENTEVKEQEG